MTSEASDAERRAQTIAAEAVNGLQMDKVQREARQRMMKDMCGGFYDEHLARTLADHLASTIATAFAAEARSHDGEWELVPREPTDDMLDQGVAVLENCQPDEWVPPSRVWSAMVSAVPLFDEGRPPPAN